MMPNSVWTVPPTRTRPSGESFQKAVAVFDSGGDGLGQSREPLAGCQVQLFRCRGVGAAPVQSQPVRNLRSLNSSS